MYEKQQVPVMVGNMGKQLHMGHNATARSAGVDSVFDAADQHLTHQFSVCVSLCLYLCVCMCVWW